MKNIDRYGLALTTSSTTAVTHYIEGVDRLLALAAGGREALTAAVDADAGLAMAHAALAFLSSREGDIEEARRSIEQAQAHMAGATRRERQHIGVFAAVIRGDGPAALALVREHLAEFPRDALVLYQGMFLLSFGGGPHPKEAILLLYDGLARAYGDDWWFLGASSFAYQELDRFDQAWPLAERSLALNPSNGNAVHALTHLHYETNEHGEGSRFLLDWLGRYPREAIYFSHFNWHLALHYFALEQFEDVMVLYSRDMAPVDGGRATVLPDVSSLLWRMELYGQAQTPLPWAAVNALAQAACGGTSPAFMAVHAGLAHAGAHDWRSLGLLIDDLGARARSGHANAGVAQRLVEAALAFAGRDFDATISSLEPVFDQVVRLGGSNAQREVFEDTLLVAYLHAERWVSATQLLRQRLARRSSRRDESWLADVQRHQVLTHEAFGVEMHERVDREVAR